MKQLAFCFWIKTSSLLATHLKLITSRKDKAGSRQPGSTRTANFYKPIGMFCLFWYIWMIRWSYLSSIKEMSWWSAAKTKSLCLDIKLYVTAAAIHYCCYYLARTSCCCITQQYTWYVRRPKHCFVDVMLWHAVLASWKNIFSLFLFLKKWLFCILLQQVERWLPAPIRV